MVNRISATSVTQKSTATEAARGAGAVRRCCSSRARTTSPPICAAGNVALIASQIQRNVSDVPRRMAGPGRHQTVPGGGIDQDRRRAHRQDREKTPADPRENADQLGHIGMPDKPGENSNPEQQADKAQGAVQAGLTCMERGASDRVEAALQDIGRRHPIDDLGAAFSCHVVRDHLAGNRRGGQPLVPQRDRHVAQRQHVARELANRLRARRVAAGHRERQSDHQPADAMPVDQREQRRRIVAKPAPADGFERAADNQPGVAERGPDRLRAHVKPEQPDGPSAPQRGVLWDR